MGPVADPKRVLGTFLSGLSSLLFPRRCAICREPLAGADLFEICGGCKSGLSLQPEHSCRVCAAPIDGEVAQAGIITCGRCRTDMPHFDMTFCGMRYEGKSRDMVHSFKFDGRARLAGILSSVLCVQLYQNEEAHKADMVLPVPLHRKRLFDRGYNQSYLLACEVGMALSIPVVTGLLVRPKYTMPQSSQTRAERKENIKNAFSVERPAEVEGKTVLLVDDIMTTGATLSEAAKTLKKNGAATVMCAVAARA